MIRLTGGHGKLTRACYEAYLSEGKHENNELYLLKKSAVQGALYEIWFNFLPLEQIFLKSFVKGDAGEIPSFLTDIGIVENNELKIVLLAGFS